MALDATPANLYEEIDQAVALRRRHTEMSEPIVRRIAGNDYRGDWTPDEDSFELHEYQYIRNAVPGWVFSNPAVNLDGLLAADEMYKHALEYGFKGWIPAVGFAKKMTALAVDCCINFGVAVCTCEVLPGYEGWDEPLPVQPDFHRLPPDRFFQDPQGGADRWRFRGHQWVQDKDVLLAAKNPDGSPMYDPEALAMQPVEVGINDDDRDKSQQKYYVKRNRIVGYELFERATGMIYTLGFARTAGGTQQVFLRPPRRWIGSPAGPYKLFGIFLLPDQVYPLSPLAVTSAKVRELNAHRGQMSDDAAAGKQLILYDKSKPENKRAIEEAPNLAVVGIDGLGAGMVQHVQIAGADPKRYDYIERLRMELHETSGLTTQDRGNTTGATATEVDEVAQADDARTAWDRAQFQGCATEVLTEAAYLFTYCDQVAFPVDVPDPMTGQMMTMVFRGGIGDGQDHTAFSRLRIGIQPYSMEMVNSGVMQRRALQLTELLTAAAPVMVQTPYINWKWVLDNLGESQNVKGLGEKALNPQTLGALQQMAALQAQQQQQMAAQESQANVQATQSKAKDSKGKGDRGSSKRSP